MRHTFWLRLVTVCIVAYAAVIGCEKVETSSSPPPPVAAQPAPPAPAAAPAAADPKVERGKYLAMHVMVCMDCHSQRDWSKLAGPLVDGTLGMGGERFGEEMGLPGTFYAANVTPTGIGSWTDDEIKKAITTGTKKDGSRIFPIMPWMSYAQADPEDIDAVVAYLRTLAPHDNKPPASEWKAPPEVIFKDMPPPPPAGKRPEPIDTVAYGKYLVTSAACAECHTPAKEGKPDFSKIFAGGFEFAMPTGVIRPANITSDKETGIGSWTKEEFVARFKSYAPENGAAPPVGPDGFQTPMPWVMYAGMSEQDLGAMYDFLQTVPAIKNKVEKFTPAAAPK